MRYLRIRPSTGVAGAALLFTLLVSCDSPTEPARKVTVSVVPSGTLSVSVGDTLTVRATVANATNSGVSFSTTNPLVASVEPTTGLVTALAAGEVTITATSAEDRTASASVQLRVMDRPSSVVIERILANGVLADYSTIRGVVNVQLGVEVGSATLLQVLVDTAVVCQQSFGGGAAGGASFARGWVPTVCSYNSAEFSATGVPRFRNGPATVSARLFGRDGGVRSATSGISIRLANRDTLLTDAVATKAAVDERGLRWVDGDVRVTAVPVLYEHGSSITRVAVAYSPPSRQTQTRIDTQPPFVVLFEEDSLAGLTVPQLTFAARTTASAGEPGPGGSTPPVRYDGQAPDPGSVSPREWIGAQTAFASLFTPLPDGDRGGVGRVQATFFYGDPILPDTAIINRGRVVIRGSDLERRAFGGYRAVASVCDALENCVLGSGFNFGVDLDAPTIESLSLGDSVVNPAADLVLGARDDLSGLAIRPVEAVVTLLDADPATPRCGPGVGGVDLPGREVGAGCAPDTVGTTLAVPRTTPGYYSYALTVLDRAGNRSVGAARNFIVDSEPPAVTSVVLPTQLLPGEEGSFGAAATDNLDLTELALRLRYAAAGPIAPVALSFDTLSTFVGRAFDQVTTTTAARTTRFPLVRSLTSVIAGTRATTLVDSLQVSAVDAARLTRTVSRAIAPSVYGDNVDTRDPFQVVTTVSPMELDVTGPLCTLSCLLNERTNVRLTMSISGGPFNQPFARVYFYQRALLGGSPVLIATLSGTSAQGEVIGGRASFRYSLVYTPAPGLTGAHDVFAVGVSSGGNALRNEPARIEFFAR